MMKRIPHARMLALSCIVLLGLSQAFIPHKSDINPVPGSCTIFTASIGTHVFFGNNEDFYKPATFLWTEPATSGNYGCLYLGFKDYAHQGGINEKGLCFDANALPKSKINPHEELAAPPHYDPPYEEHMIWLPVLILRKAATVEEAISIASKYQRKNWYPEEGTIRYQLHFADSTGDAVVMSVDRQGELVYTRKPKGDGFIISTNFNKANSENALEYPCKRYEKAEEMLTAMQTQQDLSAEYCSSILESVHQTGIFNTTLYSNVFDLRKGLLYLYHWHQFDEMVVLNIEEELTKDKYRIRIKDLFSKDTVSRASRSYIALIIFWCLGILMGTGIMIAGIHYLKRRMAKGRDRKS